MTFYIDRIILVLVFAEYKLIEEKRQAKINKKQFVFFLLFFFACVCGGGGGVQH